MDNLAHEGRAVLQDLVEYLCLDSKAPRTYPLQVLGFELAKKLIGPVK